MKKLLVALLLLVGVPVWADVVCTGTANVCANTSATAASGPGAACDDNDITRWDGATQTQLQCSAVTLDDSGNLTGIGTATGTTLVGSTTSCGGGAAAAANSVCITGNTITGEGATADTFQGFLKFGDSTADQALIFTGAASSYGVVVEAPAQAASATAGNALALTASAATAGSSNAGAAAGGAVTITGGAAARLTSGNANGGNVILAGGAGIGTGVTGGAVFPDGNATITGWRHISNAATTGWIYYSSGITAAVQSGAPTFAIAGDRVHQDSTGCYVWTNSSTDATAGSIDTGLCRSAAGVTKTTAGLSGYGSLETGGFVLDRTITAGGTTGAQTINKVAGTVNFAAAATTLVVTNSTVTANSICSVVARTNDATCSVKDYEPAAGSFTIRMTAACTAETSVGFVCFN